MSKCSDSRWFGNLTSRDTTFMLGKKDSSARKVVKNEQQYWPRKLDSYCSDLDQDDRKLDLWLLRLAPNLQDIFWKSIGNKNGINGDYVLIGGAKTRLDLWSNIFFHFTQDLDLEIFYK